MFRRVRATGGAATTVPGRTLDGSRIALVVVEHAWDIIMKITNLLRCLAPTDLPPCTLSSLQRDGGSSQIAF